MVVFTENESKYTAISWQLWSMSFFLFQGSGVLDGSGRHLQTPVRRPTQREEASSTRRSSSVVQVSRVPNPWNRRPRQKNTSPRSAKLLSPFHYCIPGRLRRNRTARTMERDVLRSHGNRRIPASRPWQRPAHALRSAGARSGAKWRTAETRGGAGCALPSVPLVVYVQSFRAAMHIR